MNLAWPDPGQPYPTGISASTLPGADPTQFLKVPMQLLLPGGPPTTQANSGWAIAMQQLATTDGIANARISSRNVRTDCPAAMPSDSSTYCMHNSWYAEAIFDALFSNPPAGTAPVFLTLGPDTQVRLGHTITLTGFGAGAGWALFGRNSWLAGDGGALPPEARVAPSNSPGTSLVFSPRHAGTYTFQLRAEDPGKNQVRAFINVTVVGPSRSPLPAASPAPAGASLAIAGPSLVAPGQAFTLKALLPAGVDSRSVGCHWRQLSGAAAHIVSLPKCQINYTAPGSPGLVNIQLKVTNTRNAVIGTATHLLQVTTRGSAPGRAPASPSPRPKGKPLVPSKGTSSSPLPGANSGQPSIPSPSQPPASTPSLPPGLQWKLPLSQPEYPPASASGKPQATPLPGNGLGDLFAPTSKKRGGKGCQLFRKI